MSGLSSWRKIFPEPPWHTVLSGHEVRGRGKPSRDTGQAGGEVPRWEHQRHSNPEALICSPQEPDGALLHMEMSRDAVPLSTSQSLAAWPGLQSSPAGGESAGQRAGGPGGCQLHCPLRRPVSSSQATGQHAKKTSKEWC